MNQPAPALILALALAALAPGCGPYVDTTYGRARAPSVNGTTVLADLFRARGHEVRAAFRLSDELKEWADVIVRFAPAPGPPAKDEAQWYSGWLSERAGRSLVYVPHDYDAESEYWARALDQLPPTANERTRDRIREAQKDADRWADRLPPPAHSPAPVAHWFDVEPKAAPVVCARLGGPWARGLDPAKAALTCVRALKVETGRVLLTGDDKPLVIDRGDVDDGRVLVAANGSFLLNLPLTEASRWPLAVRTVRWAEGEGGDGDAVAEPSAGRLRVAFVEGGGVVGGDAGMPSVWKLLDISPFGRVFGHLFALGLAACLARAPRLGRPRPDEPAGADRPVAHPEALGSLLARTRQAREARAILDAYHRRRAGHAAPRPPRHDAT